MKKVLIILGLILISLISIGGCKIETGTSFGLNIEDAFFAEVGPKGESIPVDNIFKQGEKVYFVLKNVGKFKRGNDKLNWFDINLEISDSEGNILTFQQNLMGEKGHTDILNNILPSPYAHFKASMEPGEYRVKLTIYDVIGGGSASKSKPFTVE